MTSPSDTDFEVLVVGAGISGIGIGIDLLRRGHTSFALLERNAQLGGTWRDNTYPGVAVDIPSSSYCFSFETDYPWSRAYAEGHEILAYVQHCARKYGIDAHIRTDSNVVAARFDAVGERWTVELGDGSTLSCRTLISATGLFTTPTLPDIEGLTDFAGAAFHTARWDHDCDLAGKRVAVIGTGASAVQIVPSIADRVSQLTVFQRTPVWVSPRPDYALPSADSWLAPRRLGLVRTLARWSSEANLELLTLATAVYSRIPFLIRGVAAPVRRWMSWQVTDPKTRAALLPDYNLGCKRPAPSNTYLPAFNLDHVELVTDPIERIVAEGVKTQTGALHTADVLVLATGFLTTQKGNAPAFEVYGSDGVELGQFWQDNRLQAYEGVAVPGFPNFFLTAGPYSGGFNWFAMLEAHMAVILGCLDEARTRGVHRIEVGADAHAEYMREMWGYAEGTIFKDASCDGSNSYYLDARGDAALPLPRTPWWRVMRFRKTGVSGFVFGTTGVAKTG